MVWDVAAGVIIGGAVLSAFRLGVKWLFDGEDNSIIGLCFIGGSLVLGALVIWKAKF